MMLTTADINGHTFRVGCRLWWETKQWRQQFTGTVDFIYLPPEGGRPQLFVKQDDWYGGPYRLNWDDIQEWRYL